MVFDPVAILLSEAQATWPKALEFDPQVLERSMEWAWGLGAGQLRAHVESFADAKDLLGDERMVVIPRTKDIQSLFDRVLYFNPEGMPPIMEASREVFTYYSLCLDPTALLPCRLVKRNTPPHIVAMVTEARISGATRGIQTRERLVRRTRALTYPTWFRTSVQTLDLLQCLNYSWLHGPLVPDTFTSQASNTTSVILTESVKHPSITEQLSPPPLAYSGSEHSDSEDEAPLEPERTSLIGSGASACPRL
uniref:Uncharacterized protein n=1 Tax=Mycena chlorophos TaxID=658473 RepID=A0ABQ0L4I3_MYCCL|nr:predicted protein [Mycena chlorophos]